MAGAVIEGMLAFARPEDVVADEERPGLLRALARPALADPSEALDVHACSISDWARDGGFEADLFEHGFGIADLSRFDDLQVVFERVRQARCLTEEDANAIRGQLDAATLTLSTGVQLRVRHISADGLFLRTAGPNGLDVQATLTDPRNDHGAAISIHADQDVLGTPMKQLMDGRAPELFRHHGPDTSNDAGSLLLLNVWIPLDQVSRPLVLGDSTSIDRPRHQLRYGLPVESFLERPEDQRINDIWSFLHDDGQRWYFRSEMSSTAAYLFDTFGTAHGSFILPGEDEAERAYLALEAAEDAVGRTDAGGLRDAVGDLGPIDLSAVATPALRRAITDMAQLLADAGSDPERVVTLDAAQWIAASQAARSRVVRKSIELRIVADIASRRTRRCSSPTTNVRESVPEAFVIEGRVGRPME